MYKFKLFILWSYIYISSELTRQQAPHFLFRRVESYELLKANTRFNNWQFKASIDFERNATIFADMSQLELGVQVVKSYV